MRVELGGKGRGDDSVESLLPEIDPESHSKSPERATGDRSEGLNFGLLFQQLLRLGEEFRRREQLDPSLHFAQARDGRRS